MKLSPLDLSRECGLNTLLPVGRLNGLHNMVTLIQSQIAAELRRVEQIGTTIDFVRTETVMGTAQTVASKTHSSVSDLFEDLDTSGEIAVLLSGGVDSSVALKLLLLQGYKVRAFYLKIWLEDEVAHLNE